MGGYRHRVSNFYATTSGFIGREGNGSVWRASYGRYYGKAKDISFYALVGILYRYSARYSV